MDGDNAIDAALEIKEENHYFPFGLKHKGYNNAIFGRDHQYGFGRKEEQSELGLEWLDFSARNYDASLGRWMNIDPLAEDYYSWSPYNYVYNNPLKFIDPIGMGPEWVDNGDGAWTLHKKAGISYERAKEIMANTYKFNSEGNNMGAYTDTDKVEKSKVDESKIALIGGSRDGELVLNLASRFDHFNAVSAMSTSNVSFLAITWSANTSSRIYKDKEVPYVPASLKTISPALKGDLYTAYKMMLEDKETSKKAEIKVENINGAILISSGKSDDQWLAPEMSDQIIKRLKSKDFKYYNEHIKLDGGHIAPYS